MSDPIVNKWSQRGTACVWKYTDSEPSFAGWHFSADCTGCRSLRELIGLLKQAKWTAKVDVLITRPTPSILKVPNKRGGNAPVQSPSALKIQFSPDAVPPDKWELGIRGMDLCMTIGPAVLQPLELMVIDVEHGRGDYSIGGDDKSSRLWCWWWGGA